MIEIPWPANLPQNILREGYTERTPATAMRTPMDHGPPKTRNRRSRDVRPVEGDMYMTSAQVAIFRQWYRETLIDGSLPFIWRNPRSDEEAFFLFASAPSFIPSGVGWRVGLSCRLFGVPEGLGLLFAFAHKDFAEKHWSFA